MSAPLVSRRAIAALFLERQQLDRPRGRRLSARSLGAFVEATGGLQIDSIHVLERAHHLTLHSRFGVFALPTLERLIYQRRVLFEYLAHVACFVPTSDLALHAAHMRATPERWRRRGWLKRGLVRVIDQVEAVVRAEGPLGQDAFVRPDHLGKSAGWWDWKPAQHALDFLWKSGRIGIHSRRHFQKRYAAIERVLPGLAATRPLEPGEARREVVRRSLRALGAATELDVRKYWTWPGLPAGVRRDALRELAVSGEVSELRVEGERLPWFARTEDLPALDRAGRRRVPSRGTALLSPFDSFLWHRERIARLFGFDYRIEVYVPAPKRHFGYYVLPILHDGHLIGRLDAKTHREAERLEVRSVHFEDWFTRGTRAPAAAWGEVDRDAALAGVAEALRSLATFVGASEVHLARVASRSFARPMARALEAARSG